MTIVKKTIKGVQYDYDQKKVNGKTQSKFLGRSDGKSDQRFNFKLIDEIKNTKFVDNNESSKKIFELSKKVINFAKQNGWEDAEVLDEYNVTDITMFNRTKNEVIVLTRDWNKEGSEYIDFVHIKVKPLYYEENGKKVLEDIENLKNIVDKSYDSKHVYQAFEDLLKVI
jgi:hypothetical protein